MGLFSQRASPQRIFCTPRPGGVEITWPMNGIVAAKNVKNLGGADYGRCREGGRLGSSKYNGAKKLETVERS